jgi:hypothetical protein
VDGFTDGPLDEDELTERIGIIARWSSMACLIMQNLRRDATAAGSPIHQFVNSSIRQFVNPSIRQFTILSMFILASSAA